MGLSMSFFTFIYLTFLLSFLQLTSSRQPLCHDNERIALLGFKESLVIKKSASVYPSAYPKAARWNLEGNSDCCSWEGVKCNEDTGYVIKLDLSSSCLYGSLNSAGSLFNLVHLQWLSLADNDFNGSKIPYGIKNLSRLSYLNLSFSVFSGQMPREMLELSKLESLDLSNNELQLQQPSLKCVVQKLTNLKVLDLSEINISSVLPLALTNLSSLKFLSLPNCNLQGMLLPSLDHLSNLVYLDLHWNDFWGKIPSSLGNLTNLVHLDMSRNSFSNQDPSSITNLTHLTYLDLSDNNFSSPSSSLSWVSKNTELTYLGLSNIDIGEIPFGLQNMNQLSTLILSSNQLSGPIPPHISNLTKLKNLDLSSNQLQGSIPSFIFELNNLEKLDLSSNNLSGTVDFKMFLRLENLSRLDLSSNRLSLLTNSTINANSPKFHHLRLRSCNLKGFPNFLRNQDQLYELDLSFNNITGQIPRWLLNVSRHSLESLNLSHNLLIGFDQQPVVLSWLHLSALDLSFNNLQGPLPIPRTSTITGYLISHNKMSGELQPWICKLNSLYALDLSNNNLSGKLPQCLGNFSQSMSMLNLQNNRFHGSIPQTFIKRTKLRMIDLSNNMLHGKIPRSFVNCTRLEFLDLGNNKIMDTFPSWIGTLPNLEVLSLQSNKFHGVIEQPKSKFEFPKLRIINLSHNKFTGKLPSNYFECWNAMKVVNASQLAYMMKSSSDFIFYDYSLRMVNKGNEIEYVKISNMLVSICLSNNRFEGEIPASISSLKGLRYLSLSNNNLIGGIPSSLGNLTVLESLDLSNNSLQGEIPQHLVKLTFLAFFDVSNNNLTGAIPQGAQFDTFNSSSYEGNPWLCGQPLSKKCGNSELPQKEDFQESESSFAFGWKEVAIGYANGLILGLVLGYIFCTRKYDWFVKTFGMRLKRVEIKRGWCRN